MENNKLVSVIVPVYKVENYIERCVDSIINQTYKNIEIILVDDGSPDSCGEICDRYAEKDKRIKVVHQENKGLCGARNAGMRVASGEYIGFADSDDWLCEDMYEYLVTNLEKYEADIVSCRYYRVVEGQETKARVGEEDVVMDRDEAIRELVNRFFLRSTFWNKLFRREVFEGFSFPEGRTFEGTVSMHLLFEKADKIVMLKDPKYYYCDNEGSIINTKNITNGINYCLSYIDRYYYLRDKYPDLIGKMIKDTVKPIRVLRYVCLHITQEEIDKNRENFERIRNFVIENKEYIYGTVLKSRAQRREMNNLIALTPKGFRRAHDIAGIAEKIKKIKNGIFGKKKKKKKKKKNANIAPEMTPERAEILRRLQLTLMEILGVIDDICRKNGIKYFIYGGTLLGAVRNKGIIPWDDDMDIVMYRDDFEKFAEICKTQLPEGYFYQSSLTDPGYPNIAAKIRKDNTYMCEKKWDDRKLHKGIFVDILPLDYFPENKLCGKIMLHAASFLHQVCAFKYCHSSNIIVRVLFKLAKLLPVTFWYRVRDKALKFCNRHSSHKHVCSFGSHYQPMIRRVLESEWFGDGTELELEGKMCMAPAKWEGYLLHLFGESYMELPPEDKRVCHSDLDSIRFDMSEPEDDKN